MTVVADGEVRVAVAVVAARLVCRRCGRDENVAAEFTGGACLTVAEARGFVVDGAEVAFDGRCPPCRDVTGGRNT